jgi:hypothetical protein
MIPNHSTQGRAVKRRAGVMFPTPREGKAKPAGVVFKRNGVAA